MVNLPRGVCNTLAKALELELGKIFEESVFSFANIVLCISLWPMLGKIVNNAFPSVSQIVLSFRLKGLLLSSFVLTIPFGRHRLHRSPHEWVLVQHRVEVLHRQREEVAVGLRADWRYSPRVRQQTDLSEVGAVAETRGDLTVRHHDVHDALLNEVHLVPYRALLDNNITFNRKFRWVKYISKKSNSFCTSKLS